MQYQYFEEPTILNGTGHELDRNNTAKELIIQTDIADVIAHLGFPLANAMQQYVTVVFPSGMEANDENIAQLLMKEYPNTYPKRDGIIFSGDNKVFFLASAPSKTQTLTPS